MTKQSGGTEVIKLISDISKELAIELQQELKMRWGKDSYLQEFDQAPSTRIFSLTLFLSAWIGWVMNEKIKQGVLTPSDCYLLDLVFLSVIQYQTMNLMNKIKFLVSPVIMININDGCISITFT